MKRIIDLTQTIEEGMTVYPNTRGPMLRSAASFENDGFNETELLLTTHTGTHMDAPKHLSCGASLDTMDASTFIGSACVIRCGGVSMVDMRFMEPYLDAVRAAEFVLFDTGHSAYWNTLRYFDAYPVIGLDVARHMVLGCKKGIGVDTLSPDAVDSDIEAHRLLLSYGILIIENLKNLAALPDSGFTFAAFPLKIADSDGAPVRAVAFV